MLTDLFLSAPVKIGALVLTLGMMAIQANAAHQAEDYELIVSRNRYDPQGVSIELARVQANRDRRKRVS